MDFVKLALQCILRRVLSITAFKVTLLATVVFSVLFTSKRMLLLKAVKEFTNGAAQPDDITFVVVEKFN